MVWSLLYWRGRSLPDGIDNYMAVILTAVVQTHKDIVQFNLNTKRFTLNPFPLCRKAILTMQLSPHLPRLQYYFDGRYFFLRNTRSSYMYESQHLIQGLQSWSPAILNQTAPWALIWKSIYYLLTFLHLNLKCKASEIIAEFWKRTNNLISREVRQGW